MRSPVKRISVMIGEQQYERLNKSGVNISAFIRDLIEDHFSDHVIHLTVGEKTHQLYVKVVSNTGATDADIEPLLIESLKKLLDQRLEKIKQLKSEIGK